MSGWVTPLPSSDRPTAQASVAEVAVTEKNSLSVPTLEKGRFRHSVPSHRSVSVSASPAESIQVPTAMALVAEMSVTESSSPNEDSATAGVLKFQLDPSQCSMSARTAPLLSSTDPTAQTLVPETALTDNRRFWSGKTLAGGIMVHCAPSQCSVSDDSTPVPSSKVPTAQASVAEIAVTENSSLKDPEAGLATIRQVDPSQCSMSGAAPVEEKVVPTAHASDADVASTPLILLVFASSCL